MSDWKPCTLEDICEIYDGPHATPTKQNSGPYFLSISSLQGGQLDLSESAFLSEEDYALWTKRVTPKHKDIVFSYETRLGQAGIIPDGLRCCLGRRMGLLRIKDANIADPSFLLHYYLGEPFQRVIKDNTVFGTTVDRIPLQKMGEFPIPLPPLPEQKKIAEILSGIDRRSNLLSKQIAKEDALFTSFQDQLLESIASTAFAPTHRHDSQLKILPIANLFEVQLGKMLNKEAKEHGHQFQYLGNKNIQQWNPDIRHLELMHFSEDEKRKFSLRSGDLLVCEGGDAGRCCIWEETDAEIYYQKAIHRMRPRSGDCTPTFMMHYLAYCKSRNLLSDFISKTSISHLTREKLLEIPIAIPSREEQSSIVEKLESQRKLIAKLFSKSKILKDIKSAVSSDLLSGRKRVSV